MVNTPKKQGQRGKDKTPRKKDKKTIQPIVNQGKLDIFFGSGVKNLPSKNSQVITSSKTNRKSNLLDNQSVSSKRTPTEDIRKSTKNTINTDGYHYDSIIGEYCMNMHNIVEPINKEDEINPCEDSNHQNSIESEYNLPPIIATLDYDNNEETTNDCNKGVMHDYVKAIHTQLQAETNTKKIVDKWLLKYLRNKDFWIKSDFAQTLCKLLKISFSEPSYYKDVKIWLPDL